MIHFNSEEKSHHLGLSYIYPYQIHKEIIMNENMKYLDAILFKGVEDQIIMPPEKNHTYGDQYIVDINAQGEWLNKDNYIAIWLDYYWHFIQPQEGTLKWIKNKNKLIVFNNQQWECIV